MARVPNMTFNTAHQTGTHNESDSVYFDAKYREDFVYTIDDNGEIHCDDEIPPEEVPHACLEVMRDADEVTGRWQHPDCFPADSRGYDQISYIQIDDKGS
jgi:hypothetical protein